MTSQEATRRHVHITVITVLSFLVLGLTGGCSLNRQNSADRNLVDEAYADSLNMTFVYVEPGRFMMGSPTDEPGRDNDERLHQVTLSRGFYMQTTEVSQGQWETVMGKRPAYFKKCGDGCPVEQVSWEDVQTFIRRLNKKTGQTYRLPTEAEWEYACRSGSSKAFANGDIKETGCAHDPNLNEMGWYCANADGQTHPVALKKANAWGLYDMHGNVWEWCQDHCGYESGIVVDTYKGHIVDPLCAEGDLRISRGGGFLDNACLCRSANRSARLPDYRSARLGFRLVKQ